MMKLFRIVFYKGQYYTSSQSQRSLLNLVRLVVRNENLTGQDDIICLNILTKFYDDNDATSKMFYMVFYPLVLDLRFTAYAGLCFWVVLLLQMYIECLTLE